MPVVRHHWHPVAQNLNGLEKGNVGYGQIPKGEHFVQGHLPKSRCHNGGIDLLVTRCCSHARAKVFACHTNGKLWKSIKKMVNFMCIRLANEGTAIGMATSQKSMIMTCPHEGGLMVRAIITFIGCLIIIEIIYPITYRTDAILPFAIQRIETAAIAKIFTIDAGITGSIKHLHLSFTC